MQNARRPCSRCRALPGERVVLLLLKTLREGNPRRNNTLFADAVNACCTSSCRVRDPFGWARMQGTLFELVTLGLTMAFAYLLGESTAEDNAS